MGKATKVRCRDGRDFEGLPDGVQEAHDIRFHRAGKYEKRWLKLLNGARFQNELRTHDWRLDYIGYWSSHHFTLSD